MAGVRRQVSSSPPRWWSAVGQLETSFRQVHSKTPRARSALSSRARLCQPGGQSQQFIYLVNQFVRSRVPAESELAGLLMRAITGAGTVRLGLLDLDQLRGSRCGLWVVLQLFIAC